MKKGVAAGAFVIALVSQAGYAADNGFHQAGKAGFNYFVYIDSVLQGKKEPLREYAENLCRQEGQPVCEVYIWKEKSLVPASIAMTEEQSAAQYARFSLNRHIGREVFYFVRKGGAR